MLEPGDVRPLPDTSWLTEPFWDAAAAGELKVQRCSSCERPFFRPEAACPRCLSEDWAWEVSSGRGTVHSFSVVHRPAQPGMRVPYVVADVLLDEGFHMMSNIIGCHEDDVAIDMHVRVQFVKAGDLHLPFFTRTSGNSLEEGSTDVAC